MLKRDYQGQNCSIAGALEVVDERWTLLIVRDVILGLHRFDQLQESDVLRPDEVETVPGPGLTTG